VCLRHLQHACLTVCAFQAAGGTDVATVIKQNKVCVRAFDCSLIVSSSQLSNRWHTDKPVISTSSHLVEKGTVVSVVSVFAL